MSREYINGLIVGLGIGTAVWVALGASISTWFHFQVCHKYLTKESTQPTEGTDSHE